MTRAARLTSPQQCSFAPAQRRGFFLDFYNGFRPCLIRPDRSKGQSVQRSSLNACTQSFCRKPGMHQSMHSGSIARAASTLPMSAVSQPN